MSVKGFSVGGQTQRYDHGALDNNPTIPSKTSDLTNDSGFITGSALDELDNRSLAYHGQLTSAHDMHSLSLPGMYYVLMSNAPSNFPYSGTGEARVLVNKSATAANHSGETHLVMGDGALWVERSLNGDGSLWTSWVKLADADEVSAWLDQIGNQNFGYLASVDREYLNSSDQTAYNNLLSHTDYVRIPDNAVSLTVRGYTADASGTTTYSVNPSFLVYDANKALLGYYGTTTKDSEKTYSLLDYPTAAYIRANQPGGASPIDKLIRWDYADKGYYKDYSNGFVGSYSGTFTAAQQTLNTGIMMKAGRTYCIKIHGPREASFNVFGLGNNTNYRRVRPNSYETYFTNGSADRELVAFNGAATAFDEVDLEVFEVDSVQLKAESVPRTYRVDSSNPTSADYTSLTKCLYDLRDDTDPKIIEVWGGDYDIFAEYTELYNAGLLEKYTGNDPSMDYFPYCVWVPANTHIIGKGIVRLRWEPDPTTDDITPNQCKTISPLNVAATATIENIEVYCKNGRYCLHNDGLGKAQFTGAVQRYINCRFYKFGNDTDPVSGLTYGFLPTTGFGIDNSMHHVYENCLFVNNANQRAFYGHSRSSVIAYEKNSSDITLTNCVIKSDGSPCVKLGNSSSNRNIHIRTMFSGCSISGLILSGLEGSDSSDCANGFDMQFLNCGAVSVQVNDPDNDYPPQIYGASGGAVLSEDLKRALLQLAASVAYVDANGQDYYDDLYDALYPPADLVSIAAVFTQGQTAVYAGDSLDTLKPMLTVTATYTDSHTSTVPSNDYYLSGQLVEGTSTITVTYGGKMTTFTVVVSAARPEERTITFGSVVDPTLNDHYFNSAGEPVNTYSGMRITKYIPIIGGTAVTLGAKVVYHALSTVDIVFYNSAKEIVGTADVAYASSLTYTSPSNAAYFRMADYETNADNTITYTGGVV